MGFEQKDLSGVLFKNDRKEQPNHPDYTGNALIEGTAYWLSAWIKEGARGKFMSLSFKVKEAAPAKTTAKPRGEDLDDSIPF